MAWRNCIACFFDMTLTDVAYIVKSSPYSILTAAASAGHKNWPFTSIKEGTFSMGWEDIAQLRSSRIRKATGELASMLVHAQRTGHMRRCIHDGPQETKEVWDKKCKKKKKKKAVFTPKRKTKEADAATLKTFLRVVIKEPAPPPSRTTTDAREQPLQTTTEAREQPPPTTTEARELPSRTTTEAREQPPQTTTDARERPPRATEPPTTLTGVVLLQRVLTPLKDCLPTDGLEPAIWGRKVEWLSWE